jgi:hypothetical protein
MSQELLDRNDKEAGDKVVRNMLLLQLILMTTFYPTFEETYRGGGPRSVARGKNSILLMKTVRENVDDDNILTKQIFQEPTWKRKNNWKLG